MLSLPNSFLQTNSVARNPKHLKKRRIGDPTFDQLMLVMRGFRILPSPSSEECPVGRLCPFARGAHCSGSGSGSVVVSSSDPAVDPVCSAGDACLRRQWQYKPPPPPVFDVRFSLNLHAEPCSDCFEVVHLPRSLNLVEYETCACVAIQGE